MTDFDFVPSSADDGILRSTPAGEFFDKLNAPAPGDFPGTETLFSLYSPRTAQAMSSEASPVLFPSFSASQSALEI